MKIKRLFTVLLIAFALSGCQKSPRESELSGEAQGTTYHIKLVLDGTSISLKEARREVSATLAEIDAQMSNYRENSEISRINRQENTDWLGVSRDCQVAGYRPYGLSALGRLLRSDREALV
jgi:thiamine biosynthesis lipoprotein